MKLLLTKDEEKVLYSITGNITLHCDTTLSIHKKCNIREYLFTTETIYCIKNLNDITTQFIK